VGERAATALTLAAVVAAYATAFGATFHFDDAHAVLADPAARSWAGWMASLPAIRAATKLSYAASHAISPQPWSYVLVGVALHAASALVLLALARRWLRDFGLDARRAGFAALVAALTFALHPAQTEAVTYVAGRSVALAGFLSLAALLAWERRRDGGGPWPLGASLVTFALAIAARETAVTLPFALVLLEAARGAPWREALRRAGAHFAVLAAAIAAIALSPTYARLLRESLATRSPLENLRAQVEGVAYLVTHPLLTLRVNFDPEVANPASADVGWWLAALAIAAAIALGFATLRRAPWLGCGLLWFFLHLAPTNGLVARYDLVNDRQLYLALVGPALIVGVVLAQLAAPRGRAAAATALCAALGVATLVRNTDYASELALWQATVRASPDKSRPWNNLGWALQQTGDRDGARAAYVRALELDPANFRARANLDALDSGR
jgi:tetratricopeptide (TPR) repeat protein